MITVGDKTELFIDEYLIDKTENIEFRINTPERREEVLLFSRPWEGYGSLGNTVFRHNGKIYLYYRGFPSEGSDNDEKQTACLAVSEDGIHFERAKINKFNYNGITDNNIVFMGVEAHNFAPFYDNNPKCPADEKFKAVGGILATGGIHAFKSADGVTWERMSSKPVITKGAFDSMNTAFYDTTTGLYRCYSRYWLEGGFSGCRAIQSCTSADFIHWSDPIPNAYPDKDEITEHYYTNATRPVPGAEHILISFPMRFMQDRKKLADYMSNGVSDAVFMSSRDGINWSNPFKTAWISPSMNERNWTQRNYITVSGIIDTEYEFHFYVEEKYMWDDCAVVRYSVAKNRFGSVYANSDGGSILTKPFIYDGTGFFINYASSGAGSISFAVLDENGDSVEGFDFDKCGEIYGNELHRELLWTGQSLKEMRGKAIRLSIKLNDTYLYAAGK